MRTIKLTDRMKCVADMVTLGGVVADIGCDHAYVSIYLVEQHIATKVVAMDVRKGPLDIASQNVSKRKLENDIDVRLSDGLDKLQQGEVDSIVIAGMGGQLIAGILDRGSNILLDGPDLILQPQSELHIVREKLFEHGYGIVEEKMLIDMDKYYVIMKASKKVIAGDIDRIYLKYGKYLLDHKDEVLLEYLKKEYEVLYEVYNKLISQDTDKARHRVEELNLELHDIREALSLYEL